MLKQQQFLCVASDSIWLVTLVHGRFPKICTPRLEMQVCNYRLPKVSLFTGVSSSASVFVTLVIP